MTTYETLKRELAEREEVREIAAFFQITYAEALTMYRGGA